MKIEKNKMVKIHYTLKDDDGNVIDSSEAKEVLDIWYDINERKLNSFLSIAQLLRSKNFEKINAEDVKIIENINGKKFALKIKCVFKHSKLKAAQKHSNHTK